MKLYRVEVRKTIYVVANDALEAELEGPRYAEDDNGEPLTSVTLATEKLLKRDGWMGALVYGPHTDDYLGQDAIKLND